MSSEAVFIQVGALAEGFAPHSNTLERQHGLAGTTLTLRFSDGATQRCRFTDEQTLEWGGAARRRLSRYQHSPWRVVHRFSRSCPR